MVAEDLKELYWNTMKKTRVSGRISQSLIDKTEEQWKGFDSDVVEEALLIHTSHHPNKRENYTIGIMNNLQKQKSGGNQDAEN